MLVCRAIGRYVRWRDLPRTFAALWSRDQRGLFHWDELKFREHSGKFGEQFHSQFLCGQVARKGFSFGRHKLRGFAKATIEQFTYGCNAGRFALAFHGDPRQFELCGILGDEAIRRRGLPALG